MRLRHQELALEDAVAQRRDEPQPDLPVTARDDDVLAKPAMEHVGHRVRVGDDRHDPIGLVTEQQQPRIGALRVTGCKRRLEREPPRRQKAVPRRKNPRISRLIQVQTARIVSRQQAKRLDDGRLEVEQVERVAPFASVRIVDHGQQRLDEQRVSPEP